MGVRRARYDAFSQFLATNGIAVLTFDYRGIGDSGGVPARQSTVTLTEWAEQDMEGLVEWLGRRYPGLPLIGVGHSIGGQLFGLVPSVDRFAALFLVGAQRGYPPYWCGFSRALIAAFWRLMPAIVRVFGYLPLRVAGCEAIPPRVALEWQRWGLHPDFRDAEGRSQSDRWARFRGRLLSVSFEDDLFAARAAVAALVRTYAGARAEHLHFSPSDFGRAEIGHSGFFAEDVCPALWEQVLEWLLRSAVSLAPATPRGRLSSPAPADRVDGAHIVGFAASSFSLSGRPEGHDLDSGIAREVTLRPSGLPTSRAPRQAGPTPTGRLPDDTA
jgi:predicted alpha/beta hydrolase